MTIARKPMGETQSSEAQTAALIENKASAQPART